MPRPVLRLGLIGAGRWGRLYAKTVADLRDVALTHLARAKAEPPDFLPPGCRFSSRWQEVVNDPEVDGILVVTPPQSHAEIARAALQAGKPVLIEKPLSLSLTEAEGVWEAALQHRGLAWVEHTQLFNPAFRALVQHLPGLGAIRSVVSESGAWGPFVRHTPILWDWTPHDMAMCLSAFPGPVRLQSARRSETRLTAEGEGGAYDVQLALPGEIPARLQISNLLPAKTRRFTVYGEDGVLRFDDWSENRLVRWRAGAPGREPDGTGEPVAFHYRPPLTVAVEEFAQAIASGARDMQSLRLGVEVVRLLEQAERALGGA
jgi:predicted dehydrogenase